jgi:hypothetical protein
MSAEREHDTLRHFPGLCGIAPAASLRRCIPADRGDRVAGSFAALDLDRLPISSADSSFRRGIEQRAVRFRDNGPGVAHPEELFRPFQPGAHSVGLGLYVSRGHSAVLRRGLRCEPQERGSCFAVEFVADGEGGGSKMKAEAGTIFTLLVDDHALFRESVARVLTDEPDLEVKHRASIREALQMPAQRSCWITIWDRSALRNSFRPRAVRDGLDQRDGGMPVGPAGRERDLSQAGSLGRIEGLHT